MMRSHARVVVIGGGIMGCSLLYHLTKLGWYDCVLLEKDELAAGPTRHAAGLCSHFAHDLTIMQLQANSARLYGSVLEQETGRSVDFHGCGALRITREPDRMDEFRHVQGIGRFAGLEFDILDPGELETLYPLVETGGLLGAIHLPNDGHVDGGGATRALAAGAVTGGAEIVTNAAVRRIGRTRGGEWRVGTARGEIVAETVVNAAGAWCREIGEMMGLDLPVVPMLHQYLVLDRVDEFHELARELPVILDPEERWYLRQERDGVIIGACELEGLPWGVDGVPASFGMELLPPDPERVGHIVARATARVPATADAGVRTIVNGPITFTPDANPLVGPAFGLRDAYLLTGSSRGVTEGGGAGQFLAEWIAGGGPPMDPMVVDPRRFGAWADRNYRLAKAVERFGKQFAIHYPFDEQRAGRPVHKPPIHSDLEASGAIFGCVFGRERPNWFGPLADGETARSFRKPGWFDRVRAECECVRDNVAVADLSAFSKFEITGRDAYDFVDQIGANRAPRSEGGIALVHCLTAEGGVASVFTVTRCSREKFYLTGAAAAERRDHDLLLRCIAGFGELELVNVTTKFGVLAVMGPESRTLLSRLTDAALDSGNFPWLTAREIDVAGVSSRALRVSYVGELGWELHVPVRQLRTVYLALAAEGERLEMGHFGAFATNALRLEKGYRAWGPDLTTERTPLEAGLGCFVKSAGREFPGRERMLAREQEAGRWCMHMLELEDTGLDPFYAHPVTDRGEPIGLVTSGAYGHGVKRPLALAWFRRPPSDPDDLETLIIGEAVASRIIDRAPHDPANARLKG